jgi:2-dehydro-3-deoxyphosphogluconate aldolase/(4S)-4-hydroxy-2-oxoglutarate aldolase
MGAVDEEIGQGDLGFELRHIGINAGNAEDAASIATAFSSLFNFQIKDGSSSVFAGSGIEVMKGGGVGKAGHIAIATNSVERALRYFEKRGVEFVQESFKRDANGKVFVAYFKDEIGGFAVHLLQK